MGEPGGYGRRLATLERLLEIEPTDLRGALHGAAQLVAEALGVDKVDALLPDLTADELVALGTSDTPMGRRQHELGLNRIPLASGRASEVYRTGAPFSTGRSDLDPVEWLPTVRDLGIRSSVVVPFAVGDHRRGVLLASSATPDFFTEEDLRFLQAVSRWVGIVADRAELAERIAAEAVERGRRAGADELVTVLAHDLGNLLVPLKGRVDLLRRRARREGRERDLGDADDAARAVERLRLLVADLLDAGRLDRGLFALAPRRIDLVDLVRETVDSLAIPTTPVHVDVQRDVAVFADPDRVRQALENLLTNAVKHSPPGVPIQVGAREEERDGGRWAIVTVADRGPGVEPDVLARLFTRFGRGKSSSGLGLGLYLANGIAGAHGGKLTVESTLGEGACFSLALPVDGPAVERGP